MRCYHCCTHIEPITVHKISRAPPPLGVCEYMGLFTSVQQHVMAFFKVILVVLLPSTLHDKDQLGPNLTPRCSVERLRLFMHDLKPFLWNIFQKGAEIDLRALVATLVKKATIREPPVQQALPSFYQIGI